VLVEETFPLNSSVEEFRQFLEQSRAHAAGWLGFYWGRTSEECRRSPDLADALMLGWLELFQEKAREMKSRDTLSP
jgi:hypothetical protein